MNTPLQIAVALSIVATLAAQETPPLGVRFRIDTEIEDVTSRKILVDGEPREVEMRGAPAAGSTESAVRQTVAFEERADGTRHYLQVQSDETSAAQGGEPAVTHVDGALEGRVVMIGVDDRGRSTIVEVAGEDRRELGIELAAGLPGRVDLSVLLPPAGAEDDVEYGIEGDARAAIRSLFHPVAIERSRGRGRGRGRGAVRSDLLASWIGLLESGAVQAEVTAKFRVARDGEPARVMLTVAITGEGPLDRLGLQSQPGAFGGRGFQRGGAGDGEATATLNFDCVALLNEAVTAVVAFEAEGRLELSSTRMMNLGRGGDGSEFEVQETTAATLRLRMKSDAALR